MDAGFSCPNRSSDRKTGGCIYCNNEAFTPSYIDRTLPLTQQVKKGMELLRLTKNVKSFLVYFQPFTATFADVSTVERMLNEVISIPDVVGIIIGTRPDCISNEMVNMLSNIAGRTYLWVELGLQSASDKTLKLINRGHTVEDFKKAAEALMRAGIKTGAHVILGLPGEKHEHWMQTAELLREIGIHGVKIHNIHVLKGTVLEQWYREGRFNPITREEYIKGCVDFVQRLRKDVIIMRFASTVPEKYLVAPQWAIDHQSVVEEIKQRLGISS